MRPYQYTGEELAAFAEARNWKAYVAGLITPFLKGNVLEVGAGLGSNTIQLTNTSVTSWHCLEPDEKNTAVLTRLIDGSSLLTVCSVQQGTLNDLPETAMFDSILYYDVLEHIEDDKHELQLAFKHLKPGGFLIILAPAHQAMFSAFDKSIGHFRRYDKNSLRNIIPEKLQENRCIYLDSFGFIAYKAFSVISKEEKISRNKVLIWDRCLIPLSRIFDKLSNYRYGKSILAIYQSYKF